MSAVDPRGYVRDAWTAKDAVGEIYRVGDPDLALEWVRKLVATLTDGVHCPEVRQLGRMLARWAPHIPMR